MAATKQFLLNYDSNILLPYTTLDCILGSENSDPDSDNAASGIDVITDNLLSNIKEFISYHNESGAPKDGQQIDADDVDRTSARVLGTVKMTEGSAEVYTKLFKLDLDNNAKAGNYLGEDGAIHKIYANTCVNLNSQTGKREGGWYDASLTIIPTGKADPAIGAHLSLNIDYDDKYMFVNSNKLAASHAIHSHLSEIASNAHGAVYILNKCDDSLDSSNPTSRVNYDNRKTVGDMINTPVQLRDGVFTKLAGTGFDTKDGMKPVYITSDGKLEAMAESQGTAKQPVYVKDGVVTAIDDTVGSENRPVYLNEGVFTAITTDFTEKTVLTLKGGVLGGYKGKEGDDNQPVYIKDGQITACSSTAGSAIQPIYFSGGKYYASDASVGENNAIPVYLDKGTIKPFTSYVPTTGNSKGKGSNTQPVFVDASGVIQPYTATVGEQNSCKLLWVNQGVVEVQSGAIAGADDRFCYLESGVFKPSNAVKGNITTPVYVDHGQIIQCQLTPASIGGFGDSSINKYLMTDETGRQTWGDGNTTTKGKFDADSASTTAYYIVGVSDDDSAIPNTFTALTAARKAVGSGIYFKAGELYQTSDENLKTFTGDIDINFDNLATIKKGIYHWKDDENKITDIGVTAQSLEALYPEIVDDNNGTKTVAYNRLGVIALAAIDKLHLRVKELENEIKELKAELNKK